MCDVGAMVSGLQVEASLEVGISSLVELTAEFRLQGAGSGESGSSGPSPLTDCTVPAAAARSSPARRAPQPRALPAGPRWDRRLWRLACGQAARRRGPVWSRGVSGDPMRVGVRVFLAVDPGVDLDGCPPSRFPLAACALALPRAHFDLCMSVQVWRTMYLHLAVS